MYVSIRCRCLEAESQDNLFLKSMFFSYHVHLVDWNVISCVFHFTGSGHSFHTNLPPLIILQAVDFAGVCDNQSSGESSFLVATSYRSGIFRAEHQRLVSRYIMCTSMYIPWLICFIIPTPIVPDHVQYWCNFLPLNTLGAEVHNTSDIENNTSSTPSIIFIQHKFILYNYNYALYFWCSLKTPTGHFQRFTLHLVHVRSIV